MRPRNALSLIAAAALMMPAAAACGSSGKSAGGKVTITVGCEPPKSAAGPRHDWLADVATFEKQHPDITIVSKDAFPCDDPKSFTAKLAGGQMENVFYAYLTDAQQVISSGQSADIQKYVGSVAPLKQVDPQLMKVFKGENGDIYGIPRTNYTLGLLYNRTLFQQAGLDPNSPPTTWDQVRADAKKIAGLGHGIVGYADYSANNQGGWHFTAEIYSQGGSILTPDNKKAAFNSPQGQAVLNNLAQMRWTDNSMGTRQLLKDTDVQTMMAAGKLGMYVGAPDNIPILVNQFQGKYSDYGLGPMPGGVGTLLGGDGYMFNVKDTPAQIKAGLQWLQFEYLTPGQGQFNWQRQASEKQPVGLPEPEIFINGAARGQDTQLRTQYANVPATNYQSFLSGSAGLKDNLEPKYAQQIYAVLDSVMSAVLTNRSANINQLLQQAETKVNQVIANQS